MRDGPLVVRMPGIVLAVAALLTLGAVFAATTIRPEVDFVDTVPAHAGLEPYRRLVTELDGVRFVAVYMAHDPASDTDSLRGEAFDALVIEQRALTAHLEDRFPGAFSHSLSAYEAMRQGNYMLAKILTAGNPPSDAYAFPEDPVRYDTVKRQVLSDDTLDDVLARDGSSALMLFFIATRDQAEARALTGDVGDEVAAWRQAEERHPVTTGHEPSGLLWSSHATDERNLAETVKWAPVAALATLAVMLWVTRRIGNALIATTGLVCAFAWTIGLMALLQVRISFLTFMLAPIVIGIGIDHAVHVLHRFEEERHVGHERGVGAAVTYTRRAVVVAAVTTAAALAVMGFVSAPLFAEIGVVAAVGTLLALVSALTVVPALRAIVPTRGARGLGSFGATLRRWMPSRRAGAAAVIVWLVLMGSLALANTIESGSAENELPQDDPLIVLQQRIEREYGAFQRAYLVVEGPVARAETLHALHDALGRTADLPLFREASGITSLLLADEATDQGAIDIVGATALGPTPAAPGDHDRLPQDDAEAASAIDALYQDPLWRTLVPFTTTAGRDMTVIAIQIEPWQDQKQLRALRTSLDAQAADLQRVLGPDYTVSAAGSPVNRAAVIDATPIDVAIVTVGGGIVVLAVLLVLWSREPRVALVAGAVVAASVVGILGTIPLLDAVYEALAGAGAPANTASLTSMFLLALAIAVAVSVDDVVHLAHRVRATGSVGHAMERTGRAVFGTSLTTFAAFAPLAGIYFLQSKNLAILSALGVLYAFAATYALAMWLGPTEDADGRA